MDDLSARPRPRNAQHEPAYPGTDTVLFALRAPDLTVHLASARCAMEAPHPMTACGEFDPGSEDPARG